jgi:hypothetical protein
MDEFGDRLNLVQDTSYARSKLNPVKKEATKRVKWRLTQYALPLDTALTMADEEEDIIGGNGIVRRVLELYKGPSSVDQTRSVSRHPI